MSFRSPYTQLPTTPLFPPPQPHSAVSSSSVPSSSTSANAAAASNWDTLRRQARNLENEIEGKLVGYSRIGSGGGSAGYGVGSSSSSGGGSWNSAEAAELELEELLKKLTWVVNSMSSCLDNLPSSMPTNPSMMHMLQRHRDILYDYSKEFKKTKANIASARDHAELLTSIRNDISTYKSSSSSNMQDYLLTERGKIDSSHRMADIVLE
ncbi:Golgi SNAP receptor complex member 1 [Borealophlyctis nickersoniae]|nr:Golgi SNAP receptor complex member 1 [Borealophlyctis nickersoniae]